MSLAKWSRKLHRWGSIITLIPVGIIIVTGIMLQWKKQSDWIQPPMQRGSSKELAISFDRILEVAGSIPESDIHGWDDIDRLDVRPGKGMVKVRAKNRWEIQLDTKTGEVLQLAYRRSDLIESIHDGSFLHDSVKPRIFFPAAVVLLGVCLTGLYLFFLPYLAKRQHKRTLQS
jgi:hypothetical protein